MQRFFFTVCLILATSGIATAQGPAAAIARFDATAIRTFDLQAMDRAADACTDFYQYACGNWLKSNPIPSDQAKWGRFGELAENNRRILRAILEDVASPASRRTANNQKIGDFYASCMDEEAIEKKGIAPLKPHLDRIVQLKTKADLPAYLAHLHVNGWNAFFAIGSEPDFKNSSTVIAGISQAGIGLPDRDYYFRDDPKSKELREKYIRHIKNMFLLLNWAPDKAESAATTVLRIETALAEASLDRGALRDPSAVYHKMQVKDLQALSPAFEWNRYFAQIPSPKFADLNVGMPDFIKGLNHVIETASIEDIQSYLTWNVLRDAAPMLPRTFIDEHFAFNGKTLTGQQELRPRWKRCVAYTDAALGEALGVAYVDKTFGAEGKKRTLAMVRALEESLGRDLQDLPWMTEETKKQALVKLNAITNKVGYPDKWRDYAKLNIVRGDALGNAMRAAEFESRRQLAKIGGPVDKTEWAMTPPTVNAYYNPLENNINFPAGILQPPFFDRNGDDGPNYGGIGAVIGHELTHGFDDMGRQFDAQGNLRDWWTERDAKAFDERAQCFIDEYNGFIAIDDVHVNGKLTLGENIADNGGLNIALMAYLADAGKNAKSIEGFTPEQRFFLGWGQIWCENVTPEAERLQAQSNEHTAPRFRVNGVVRNMPEFEKAFQCKPGAAMAPVNRCRVW
jgi:putative endopeptidase